MVIIFQYIYIIDIAVYILSLCTMYTLYIYYEQSLFVLLSVLLFENIIYYYYYYYEQSGNLYFRIVIILLLRNNNSSDCERHTCGGAPCHP